MINNSNNLVGNSVSNPANNSKNNSNIKTIGIIGGGQLGRMICFAAHKMGFKTVIFSDVEQSPASFVSNNTIFGSYDDESAIEKFISQIDLATFEFENIPLTTIEKIERKTSVFPSSNVLKITQNRIFEKDFLNSIAAKTTQYCEINNLTELEKKAADFGSSILKTATMGYDGKGQFVIKSQENLAEIFQKVKNQKLILEKFCPFDCEISVIVARSKNGEIISYQPLLNIHKNGILDESHFPAKISDSLKIKAQKLAEKIALEIDLIGVLAVEMFVVGDEILINELAPRPHNSGHFSMDGSITSQFEQLIRAIIGIKLGSTKFHSQGFMKNLIGSDVLDLAKFYQNENAKLHLYGKDEIKEGRKMGHVNLLNYTISTC